MLIVVCQTLLLALVLMLCPVWAMADELEPCFRHHGARFGIDPLLLRAIATVESGLRPEAMNTEHQARTGTQDHGLMQINSGWLPTLQRYGIDAQALRQPCTSIEVGAWILADLIKRHGNSWDAVGAYNAACTQLKGEQCQAARSRYTWKVFRAMSKAQAQRQTALQVASAGTGRPTP